MIKSIIFFNNGNTACFDEKGQQIPLLQRPYIGLFCEYLETQGIDPAKIIFTMPDNRLAKPFRTELGSWNWKMLDNSKEEIDKAFKQLKTVNKAIKKHFGG